MRKAILAVVMTGVLVVGGALVVAAQTDDTTSNDTDATERGPIGHAIEEVLDDLVADETLTQAQADAVIEALEAKRDEFQQERQATREQMREFWADDQLTQGEIDQLPEWNRWSGLTDALEDGVITRDEIGDMRGGRRLHGLGGMGR